MQRSFHQRLVPKVPILDGNRKHLFCILNNFHPKTQDDLLVQLIDFETQVLLIRGDLLLTEVFEIMS
jgi:hypothetical protein